MTFPHCSCSLTAPLAELGSVDVLCINHGVWNVAANSWEMDEAHFEESVDIMLNGSFKVAKAFIPKMLEGHRGGSIILTSSASGTEGQPGAIAYCTAKAGVINMMRVLAVELGSEWIRVNAICPGGVETPMLLEGGTVERAAQMNPQFITNNRKPPADRMAAGESISDAVLWLATDDSKYVTGVALAVDAGWSTY